MADTENTESTEENTEEELPIEYLLALQSAYEICRSVVGNDFSLVAMPDLDGRLKSGPGIVVEIGSRILEDVRAQFLIPIDSESVMSIRRVAIMVAEQIYEAEEKAIAKSQNSGLIIPDGVGSLVIPKR